MHGSNIPKEPSERTTLPALGHQCQSSSRTRIKVFPVPVWALSSVGVESGVGRKPMGVLMWGGWKSLKKLEDWKDAVHYD